MQIVRSSHRGSRDIEHIGSAHDDAELEVLKAVVRQRLAAGQGVLDPGPRPRRGCWQRARRSLTPSPTITAGCFADPAWHPFCLSTEDVPDQA